MSTILSGSDKPVLLIRNDKIGVIRLNRPKRLNAADDEMIDELRLALKKLADDVAIRAVVIIGAGRSFMSGADISLFQRDLEAAPATAARLIDKFHGMLRDIRMLPKPVIAALSGSVAGGGVGLALACDLCVMADNARLIAGYSKLGTNPDAGTTWSLTHTLGRQRALEVMLLNDPISAEEAYAKGLVNKIVLAATLEDEALALAGRVAEGAPEATARIKALVDEACVASFDAQLDKEKLGFVSASRGPEFREGIVAFFERRLPRF